MAKVVLDVSIKNKEERYKKIIEISKNNNYTTGNLLDYEYFSNLYKLIAIDLSKQTEQQNPDLKSKIGKLEKDNGATMFFIIVKPEKTTFNFLQGFVSII